MRKRGGRYLCPNLLKVASATAVVVVLVSFCMYYNVLWWPPFPLFLDWFSIIAFTSKSATLLSTVLSFCWWVQCDLLQYLMTTYGWTDELSIVVGKWMVRSEPFFFYKIYSFVTAIRENHLAEREHNDKHWLSRAKGRVTTRRIVLIVVLCFILLTLHFSVSSFPPRFPGRDV